MKIQTECVPCLIKRILFETQLVTEDKKIQTEVIRAACKKLSEIYDPDECSAVIASQLHKTVYTTLHNNDPYAKLKQNSNAIATALLPKVETVISKAKDRLKASMICAIIGNIMDFGIEGSSSTPEALQESFDRLYKEGLGHDDYKTLKSLLKNASRIAFFTDNCGEIVFDKILCRELKRFNPAMSITVVVKGTPILSDATIEDADAILFSEVVDNVFTTGNFAVGVDFTKLSPQLKETLCTADVIICKGMANYESFSETSYRPIAYLLRTKCAAIARAMNLPQNISAIKVYE